MIWHALIYLSYSVLDFILSVEVDPAVWIFLGYAYTGVSIVARFLPPISWLPYEALGNVVTVLTGVYMTFGAVAVVYFFLRLFRIAGS